MILKQLHTGHSMVTSYKKCDIQDAEWNVSPEFATETKILWALLC